MNNVRESSIYAAS